LVLFLLQTFIPSLPRYIYGEDPASQNDYFGIVIHEMPSSTRANPKPVPLLRDVYALNHTSFDKIIDFHTRVLFPKSPPSLMVFDYTKERAFTDLMENMFGKSRVTKINFSASTSGTKKMLKDDGLSILKQGYRFPNPASIKNPAKAELVRELITPLKHEEMLLTPSGRESFDHPTGRHNDLGIAWELSIHGCIQMGLKVDLPGNHVGSQILEEHQLMQTLPVGDITTINSAFTHYSQLQ
jgi:hypothetical protein